MSDSVSRGRRDAIADWLFLVGIVFKGLDGVVEVLIGIPLLFLTHVQIVQIVQAMTAGELAEDPNDFLANLILHESTKLGAGVMFVGGIYLLVHGGVKIIVVIALFRGSQRAYPWAVAVLSALLVVQVIDLVARFSFGVLALSVLDAIIIALTIREWRHGRSLPEVARARWAALQAVLRRS